jgi:hypothetical protein
MLEALTRRQILRLLGAGAAASFAGETFLYASARRITVAGRTVRVLVSSITRHTVRFTLAEETAAPVKVPNDGSLLENIPAAAPFTPSEHGGRLTDHCSKIFLPPRRSHHPNMAAGSAICMSTSLRTRSTFASNLSTAAPFKN